MSLAEDLVRIDLLIAKQAHERGDMLFLGTPDPELVRARDTVRAMSDLLLAAKDVIERADTSEGVCCCGDDMERHADPMSSGHSPVDAGSYHAMRVIEQIDALLGDPK